MHPKHALYQAEPQPEIKNLVGVPRIELGTLASDASRRPSSVHVHSEKSRKLLSNFTRESHSVSLGQKLGRGGGTRTRKAKLGTSFQSWLASFTILPPDRLAARGGLEITDLQPRAW